MTDAQLAEYKARLNAAPTIDAFREEIEKVAAHLGGAHIIELQPDGWTLMHPLSCRPNLFACDYNRAAASLPPVATKLGGRFYCELDGDGDLILGQPYPQIQPDGAGRG